MVYVICMFTICIIVDFIFLIFFVVKLLMLFDYVTLAFELRFKGLDYLNIFVHMEDAQLISGGSASWYSEIRRIRTFTLVSLLGVV